MSKLRKPSVFVPIVIAFLFGVVGMYVLHPPAVSAQRTSLASLESAINDLQARLAVIEEGIFDADIEAAGNITAGGDIAASGGVKVGVTAVDASTATAGMLRWSPVFKELEVSDGTVWSPLFSDAGSQEVQRDFIRWGTTASGTQPVYIKTNVPAGSGVMYRIAVEGYAYGGAQIINSVAAGYTYAPSPGTIDASTTTNYSSGATISQYISTDGFVVIRLQLGNTFFMGFSASAWFTNPAGRGFQISAEVLHGVAAP